MTYTIDRMRMQFAMLGVSVLTWLVTSPDRLTAQQMHRSYGSARIIGTVKDAVTNRMVLRANVCSEIDTHDNRGARPCVSPDSAGNFELTGLPAELNKFSVSCPGRTGPLDRRLLHRRDVELSENESLRVNIVADATGCDMRPMTVRPGIFEGIHHSEFENMYFSSCDGSAHGAPWFTAAAEESIHQVKLPLAVSHRYWMRFEGVFRGPARYGHGGGSAYGVNVIRVLAVREARPDDCASEKAQRARQRATPAEVHRQWWTALTSADTATLSRLSEPQVSVTLAGGGDYDLDALRRLISASRHRTTPLWEFESVQELSRDVRVVKAQLTGADLVRPGVFRVQTVLNRRGNDWRVITAQSTPEPVFSPPSGQTVVSGEFDGRYRTSRGAQVQTVSRDSVITVFGLEGGVQTYRPIGPALFEANRVDADGMIRRLYFARDRTGRVVSMNIILNGMVLEYSRYP